MTADPPATATVVHMLRHGEVHNPGRVLYGRLSGYGLSDAGMRMAQAAADVLAGRDVTHVVSSPLERALQTAAPVAAAHGLDVVVDERLVEPRNVFEGQPVTSFAQPSSWWYLRNPFRPSWGEPYDVIAARMLAAVTDARDAAHGHEAVCVTHQLPIIALRRLVERRRLWHRPDRRLCALASLTSLTWCDDRITAVTYTEPAGRHEATPGA